MKQEYILKNGIVLEYDGPKHTYKVNGKNIPSVTGITNKGLIKGGLTDWLINHPQGVAKKNINDLLDQGIELDRFKLEKIFEEASLSTDKIKKEAGLIGSVVHGLIEDFLNGKEIPNQSDKRVVNCWNIFLDWWNKQELKPIEIEKKLYSKKYNYAGTLDLIAENNKKELVLIDFKTSNQVSFDYYLQLNAYWYAYEEETGNKISEAIVVRLPKNAKKVDVQTIPLNQTLLNAFIGAKNIMTSMDDYWD